MPLNKKVLLAIPLVLAACQASPNPAQGPRHYGYGGVPGIVGFNGWPPFAQPVPPPVGGPPVVVPPTQGPPAATPTPAPSEAPSAAPSEGPGGAPSEAPSAAPSEAPSAAPSEEPSAAPSEAPSAAPSEEPSAAPSEAPSAAPSEAPSAAPTEAPTAAPTEAPTPAPTEAPTAAPAPAPVAVDIPGHSFSPGDVTVPVGTTVTWTNSDKDAHTATSDDGSAVKFDSGLLEAGKSFSFTFSTAGTFPYHCMFHSEMKGTVTVQ